MSKSIITQSTKCFKGTVGSRSKIFSNLKIFLAALIAGVTVPAGRALRCAVRTLQRVGAAVQPHMHRDRLPRAAGVSLLAAATILMVASSLVGIGLQVYVDGEPVGFVASRDDFYHVVENVEAKAGVILGYHYTLDIDVEYKLEMYDRRASFDPAAVEQVLFNGIDEVEQMYVLTVDGEVLAANHNRDAIEQVLTGIIDQTLEGEETDNVVAAFTRDVDVELQYTAATYQASIPEIESKLTSNLVEQMEYVVADGDLFSDIAARHGMSADALAALNPDINPALIVEGDTLKVSEAVPLMSVKLTKREESIVEVPFEVEYVSSSTMWSGDEVVTTAGRNGSMKIVADVVYVDGKESERTVLSEEYIEEPVTKVVTRGTRNFILPFPGYKTISSRYGWRNFRGRSDNHTGIDFAGNYGSKVVASFGGTVEFSGWKGNYGNCVIVNHGGGFKTLYAHNSKLAVSVGTKVTQGQTIAYVGSTGRSTGNHCHFEILINGVPTNPWRYLFG